MTDDETNDGPDTGKAAAAWAGLVEAAEGRAGVGPRHTWPKGLEDVWADVQQLEPTDSRDLLMASVLFSSLGRLLAEELVGADRALRQQGDDPD